MGKKTKPLRVVLDTGVVVSSLLFSRDKWVWLREQWIWSYIKPIVCRSTTLELIKVLAYPKLNLTLNERNALLEEYLPFAETARDPQNIGGLMKCRDPQDQVFINLAMEQNADYLISGDKDLLEYPNKDVVILSPAAFRKVIEAL